MAVYQLGALVTKIKGSIGGTTFKTQRTTNVVMRKSYGYGRSKLLSNAALQYARYIFTKWSFLTPEEQSSWQNTAAIVLFPDKFGNQVHITGRQLFTKVNINLQKENYYQSVPEGFTMNVPVLDVETALLNPAVKYASLGVEFFDSATGYVIISAEVSINNLQSAVFSRRFALTRSLTTGAALIEFGNEFFERFPYVTTAYNVRMYVEAMNIYGIKGLPQAVPVEFINDEPEFEIFPYFVGSTYEVGIPIASDLPPDTVYNVHAQFDPAGFPAPDFSSSTFVAERSIAGGSALSMSYLLNGFPFRLASGNFVRLWVQPKLIDGTLLTPQSVIAQELPPQGSVPVSNAELRYNVGGGSEIAVVIFNNNFTANFPAINVIMLFVQFVAWVPASPIPLFSVPYLNTDTHGKIQLWAMFDTITWNPTLRRIEYSGLKPEFSESTIIQVESQNVSTVL